MTWSAFIDALASEYTALVLVTVFFAFAKLYSEVKNQVVPLRAFLSLPALLYLALVMPLTFLAYFSVSGDGGFPKYIDVLLAAGGGVLGTIELAGTKIEGFRNVVQGLADSIKERIGLRITQHEVASQARLHAKLVNQVPDPVLEREVAFLGETLPSGDPLAKRWAMAKILIKKNPIRASQLVRIKKWKLDSQQQ